MTKINVGYRINNVNIYEQKVIDKEWADIHPEDVKKTLPERAILSGYVLAPEEYLNGK